jgi:hypothetical protein
MFIEPLWHESLIALLVVINGLYGAPDKTQLNRKLSPEDVTVIARSLEQRAYRPEEWFAIGGQGASRAVSPATPPIIANTRYDMVCLGLEPAGLEHISKRSGGLLYEDPFYAVLAAYNLGQKKIHRVEVKVPSREQAWSQRSQILSELRQNTYRAENYFVIAGARVVGLDTPLWRIAAISGQDLSRLDISGQTEVSVGEVPVRLYGLYQFVAPTK